MVVVVAEAVEEIGMTVVGEIHDLLQDTDVPRRHQEEKPIYTFRLVPEEETRVVESHHQRDGATHPVNDQGPGHLHRDDAVNTLLRDLLAAVAHRQVLLVGADDAHPAAQEALLDGTHQTMRLKDHAHEVLDSVARDEISQRPLHPDPLLVDVTGETKQCPNHIHIPHLQPVIQTDQSD